MGQASHSQKACSHVHPFQAPYSTAIRKKLAVMCIHSRPRDQQHTIHQLNGPQAMPAAEPPSLPKVSLYTGALRPCQKFHSVKRTFIATLILTFHEDRLIRQVSTNMLYDPNGPPIMLTKAAHNYAQPALSANSNPTPVLWHIAHALCKWDFTTLYVSVQPIPPVKTYIKNPVGRQGAYFCAAYGQLTDTSHTASLPTSPLRKHCEPQSRSDRPCWTSGRAAALPQQCPQAESYPPVRHGPPSLRSSSSPGRLPSREPSHSAPATAPNTPSVLSNQSLFIHLQISRTFIKINNMSLASPLLLQETFSQILPSTTTCPSAPAMFLHTHHSTVHAHPPVC